MVFNATFNNMSDISWRSVLLPEENEVPEKTTDKLLTTFITDVVSSSPRITLVVIGTDLFLLFLSLCLSIESSTVVGCTNVPLLLLLLQSVPTTTNCVMSMLACGDV